MYGQANPTAEAYALLGQIMFWGLVALLFASPICSAIVAKARGRDAAAWFILGLVFGPFGLIAAVGMPIIDRESERAYLGTSDTRKVCPACRETMWMAASICPHCQSAVERA